MITNDWKRCADNMERDRRNERVIVGKLIYFVTYTSADRNGWREANEWIPKRWIDYMCAFCTRSVARGLSDGALRRE
jgi:hypothetical protein